MVRVTCSVARKKRYKKMLKLCRGFKGRAKNCYRVASLRLLRSEQHQYRDRKVRKRQMRGLWIQRIGAAAGEHGLSYSRFMHSLKSRGILMNRKMLAELAVNSPEVFRDLCQER